MTYLSERLEIRLTPSTMRRLREEARRRGIAVGALAREALDRIVTSERESRAKAAEELFRVGAPVADWDSMKREIEDARRQLP
ncbi:MAG: ribbon-helix-helix protein, CopG family [Chloroflexi bacterium]|nr:ribbon-helix-helix protein, CopG family [Chloroflexota bacterium]